jgi:small subunit ribosomal protein S1
MTRSTNFDHKHLDDSLGFSLENDEFLKVMEGMSEHPVLEGRVVDGVVLDIQDSRVWLDVGLKSQGFIDIKELLQENIAYEDIKVGSTLKVFVERYENRHGEVALSREKALRAMEWEDIEKKIKNNETIQGTITGKVKGGFTVQVGRLNAFLPGSHLDLRSLRDPNQILGKVQEFAILKMDQSRSNLVLSRRLVFEAKQALSKTRILEQIQEGAVIEGTVRSIVVYGAFIDFGGVDGLLHVKDMSWERIADPHTLLKVGQVVKVVVIRFIRETCRISLGMKQLERDPWKDIQDRYSVGQKLKGIVTMIFDYGAFVQLEPGVEGLVHISEIMWGKWGGDEEKSQAHPSDVLQIDQEVEVMILDVNLGKRRISLGMKQCQNDPFTAFQKEHPIGSIVSVVVKDITEFGLSVQVTEQINGTIYGGDLSWTEDKIIALNKYKRGDVIQACILSISMKYERVFLGVKQMFSAEIQKKMQTWEVGTELICKVSGKFSTGVEVDLLGKTLTGFIKQYELNQDDISLEVGQYIRARIISIDKISCKIFLTYSRTAKDSEIQEYENEVVINKNNKNF